MYCSIIHNGHQIEFENTWTAKEIVTYDGQIVSEKRSFHGGVHVFNVIEGDEPAQYEVEANFNFRGFMSYLGLTIRRNGVLLFTNDPRHKRSRQRFALKSSHETRTYEPLSTSTGPKRETLVREVLLVVCHHCGHRNETTKRFCEKCGASV